MCSITSCWKGFKLKNFLRFARTPVTKRKRAWMLKKLWMPFLAHTSASGWTTLFRTITGYSTPGPLQRLCFRTDACAGFTGSERFRRVKAGLQADKHSDGVWGRPPKTLADEETSINNSGKALAFDHIMREGMVTFDKNKNSRLNNGVIPQRRSLKGILLLFIEPYIGGARDSEKYINPHIIKVSVTVNGSPHKKNTSTAWKRSICGRRSAGTFSPKMSQAKYTSQGSTQTSLGCSSTFGPCWTAQCTEAASVLWTPKTVCSLRFTGRNLAREMWIATLSQSAVLRWTSWTNGSSLCNVKI